MAESLADTDLNTAAVLYNKSSLSSRKTSKSHSSMASQQPTRLVSKRQQG